MWANWWKNGERRFLEVSKEELVVESIKKIRIFGRVSNLIVAKYVYRRDSFDKNKRHLVINGQEASKFNIVSLTTSVRMSE